jgi:hypothetical protein
MTTGAFDFLGTISKNRRYVPRTFPRHPTRLPTTPTPSTIPCRASVKALRCPHDNRLETFSDRPGTLRRSAGAKRPQKKSRQRKQRHGRRKRQKRPERSSRQEFRTRQHNERQPQRHDDGHSRQSKPGFRIAQQHDGQSQRHDDGHGRQPIHRKQDSANSRARRRARPKSNPGVRPARCTSSQVSPLEALAIHLSADLNATLDPKSLRQSWSHLFRADFIGRSVPPNPGFPQCPGIRSSSPGRRFCLI